MILARFAIVLLGLVAASLADAASQRTFVSTSGVDNPACSIASPCRAFAAALAATTPGGEIIVLDSGGYGGVTVAQSVSIISPPGVYAGVSVFSGDGITVAAGPSGKVTLRGLTINGQGGNNGIVVTSGAEVHVEDCVVANMASDGIRIDGGTRVEVRGSLVRSNGQHGLDVAAGAPAVRVIDSQFSRNGAHGIMVAAGSLDAARIAADANGNNGVRAQPATAVTVTVTMTDSALSGNGLTGAVAIPSFAGSAARLAIARSTSARNSGGGFGTNTMDVGTAFLTVTDSASLENAGNGVIVSGTNATGIVTRSTIARNVGPDFDQGGGPSIFRSSGNNTLSGRGAPDIDGTITPNPTQ
jgi:hypothetical protein